MPDGIKKERLFQELRLLEEYLTAVVDPDPKFLRIHAEILMAHIDELEDCRPRLTAG